MFGAATISAARMSALAFNSHYTHIVSNIDSASDGEES